MRNFIVSLMMLCWFLIMAEPLNVLANSSDEVRFIVTFEDKVDLRVIEKADGKLIDKFDSVPIASVTMSSDSLDELRKNPDVKSVEKDFLVRTKSQVEDWGIQAINVPSAWNTGYTGKGVKIAVIDSGISPHAHLVIAGGISFVDYTSSISDDK